MAAETSSSRRKPKARARDLSKLVKLAAASLSAGYDAALSAKRAAECLDCMGKMAKQHTADYFDHLLELAIAAMRAPGAESGYAIAVRVIGTMDLLRSDYGGGADQSLYKRTLPPGVYYSPWGAGYPYQARVWNPEAKKLVSLGRHPTPERAAEEVARYKSGLSESS